MFWQPAIVALLVGLRYLLWFLVVFAAVVWRCLSVCREMVADSATRRLLLCLFDDELADFFNVSADNRSQINGVDRRPRPVWNGTGAKSWNDDGSETTWLRDRIKTKLVPTICVVGIVGNLLTLVVLAFQRLRAGAPADDGRIPTCITCITCITCCPGIRRCRSYRRAESQRLVAGACRLRYDAVRCPSTPWCDDVRQSLSLCQPLIPAAVPGNAI